MGRESLIAAIKPTIEGWLLYLSGALTQHDTRASKRRGYNPNALGMYMGIVGDLRAKLRGVLKSEDPADLKKLQALLKRAFIPGSMRPADKTIEKIDKFLATGAIPAYGKAATGLAAATETFQEHLASEAMVERVAAKGSDARAAKFLAKWSKADAERFGGLIGSFNGLDLPWMRQSVVHMQADVASIAEEDPKDVARYLKDTRSQNTGYWTNHRAKHAHAMFDNIKALKQFVTDWERAMKP